MGRFVEEADRGQWWLLPECLDDFIDRDNSCRVLGRDGLWGGWAGGNGSAVVPSRGSAEAVRLRLSESGAVEPAARTRGRTQRRGHVATGPAPARSQNNLRLSQKQ